MKIPAYNVFGVVQKVKIIPKLSFDSLPLEYYKDKMAGVSVRYVLVISLYCRGG